MSYKKVDQLLSDAREWTVVPDRDRREIFDDVMQVVSKREREEAKVLRKRNIKVFNEILGGMPNLTYRTTWSEAQQMLLDNTKFTGDVELQSLDKEDALICFEEHVCMLEQEHDEEKERERRKQKRVQRKNREAFIVLLDELHEQKLLTSTSMWKDLYSIISRDERFDCMLAQRGSTPLDLFKFYVEALKVRYPAEKKIVKEIMKDSGFSVDLNTSFEDFINMIFKDDRSKGIDHGNLRMSFDSLVEKAQGRERERQREDARRQRKIEQSFCDMLCSAKFISPDTTWDQVREHFSDHPAFCALSLESERIRIFKDHIISLDSAAAAAAAAEGEKLRRKEKDKHRHRKEQSVSSDHRDKNKKRAASVSPDPSEASATRNSDAEADADSGKRKHRKSKKSKRKKSKHHKHRKYDDHQPGDEELEEGEAADEDDDDDDTGHGRTSSKQQHRRRKHRHARSSDPEDGEEVDSGSDEEVYDRSSKRKRR